MSKLLSVVGLMERDGLVLAVSRKGNREDLGLPGGKIEPGESPEEALAREVMEETGVRVVLARGVFEVPHARVYEILAWEGEPSSQEGTAVLWVRPERLLEPQCSFRDFNRALFQSLGKDQIR